MGEPKYSGVFSIDEYLELSEKEDVKLEYVDGEVYGMAGGTYEHGLIAKNLLVSLTNALKKAGKSCTALGSDVRLAMEERNTFAFPDAFVLCGKPEFSEKVKDAVKNPVVIFEILSPSTERYDKTKKFSRYRSLNSFQEFVLIDPLDAFANVYFRKGENNWEINSPDSLDSELHLQSIDIKISMAEIYEGVEFKDVKGWNE